MSPLIEMWWILVFLTNGSTKEPIKKQEFTNIEYNFRTRTGIVVATLSTIWSTTSAIVIGT